MLSINPHNEEVSVEHRVLIFSTAALFVFATHVWILYLIMPHGVKVGAGVAAGAAVGATLVAGAGVGALVGPAVGATVGVAVGAFGAGLVVVVHVPPEATVHTAPTPVIAISAASSTRLVDTVSQDVQPCRDSAASAAKDASTTHL